MDKPNFTEQIQIENDRNANPRSVKPVPSYKDAFPKKRAKPLKGRREKLNGK